MMYNGATYLTFHCFKMGCMCGHIPYLNLRNMLFQLVYNEICFI